MFFLTYANMDSVSSQVSGSSSVLAADWNTFVRDNFDDLKAGHVVLDTAGRLALGSPAKGTMVFDSTLDILMVFNGGVWTVGSGSSLTSTQKSAIPSPTTGTMVYDSTLGVFQYYSGSGWVNLQGTPPSLTTAQKAALGSVTAGVTVYDSTLGVFQRYTGSAWANAEGTPPLLSTAQKTALGTPAAGTMVYDSTLSLLQGYNGTSWVEIANLSNNSTPTGVISPYAGATSPNGWLLCNGDTVPNASGTVQGQTKDFSVLYGILAGAYGGAGLLPDLRGRAVFGKDNMGGTAAARITTAGIPTTGGITLGSAGGTETHLLTAAQSGLPDHKHDMRVENQGGSAYPTLYAFTDGTTGFVGHDVTGAGSRGVGTSTGSSFRWVVGVGGLPAGAQPAASAHQNLPPTIILNYIIKI